MTFLRSLAAAAMFAAASPAFAQPAATYPRMAPVDQYLMPRVEEIALAKSAAPGSISEHAGVIVLNRTGYETAVTGTNGWVCLVARGFAGAPDWAERWNPRIRAAECENPQAARSVLPFLKLRTADAIAGRSAADTVARLHAALRSGEIPPLENGAMSYMMSKDAYLTDATPHAMPHVMFFVPVDTAADWGVNTGDTPLFGGSYWFMTESAEARAAHLPSLAVYLIGVGNWSDGTPSAPHRM